MVAQANDADDFYAQTLAKFSEETGTEVEVIPYPSDAYNTQVTTQLQAGNAADLMVLAPGTGQPISVIARRGRLPRAARRGSVGRHPRGHRGALRDRWRDLRSADVAHAGRTGLERTAGGEAGVDEYPATFDDLLAACTTARDGGKSFTVLAGSIPFNTGLLAQIVSATRVYERRPDWTSSAPPVTSPSPTADGATCSRTSSR